LDQVKQAPFRIRLEGDEDVNITVRPEVGAQGRAENRKFCDLPFLTELADSDLVNLQNSHCFSSKISRPKADILP
jgi:hypothetical protein